MQKAIYEYYSPATWNNLEFNSIFDTEGIEKTKDELVSMYKSGELSSAEMLEQFPKLNEAIKQSEMITGESSDVYKEFFNEIAALAEKQADVVNETLNAPNIPSTITSSIQQIASQLEPQFAELGEAYKDIFTSDGFTLENVDNSMLESLRKSFAEIEEEIGVTFDATQLESFFSVLSDGNSTAEEVQNAFNNIATSYLFSTDVLESLNTATIESITKQLEALGITNASEVATEALAIKEEYLAFARREHIDETGKLISVAQDLADATADDINVLMNLNVPKASVINLFMLMVRWFTEQMKTLSVMQKTPLMMPNMM